MPSTLDRWRDRLRTLRLDAHVDTERDRRVRCIAGEGEALLAIAVVEPPLHAPQLAAAHAIGRPRGEADAVAGVLRQVRQVLQADALAVLAVAGGAGEVIRAGAEEEHALAHLVHAPHLGMRLRQVELQAARFGRDPRHEAFEAGLLALAEARGGDGLGIEALQGLHAVEQPRLQVLHALRVGEPAWQLDEGAGDDARPLAEIAALQRGVLRAARRLPQRLALGLEQLGRVAVGEHRAVLRDAVSGVVLRVQRAGREQRCDAGRDVLHATTASSVRLSPRLSCQLMLVLSPAFAPFRGICRYGFV